MESYLRARAFDVQATQSPHMALSMAAAAKESGAPYDIVFFDYAMPEMDGVSLADAMGPGPLKILITSQPGRAGIAGIKDAGIHAYLTKPLRPSDLMAMIAHLDDLRREGSLPDEPITRHKIYNGAGGGQDKSVPYYKDARVLVAEDNPTNQEILTAMLAHYGVTPVIVGDGRAAHRQIRKGRFDLVFMDCQMPVMDGYEATREIRRDKGGQEITIIALTANVMQGDREKCLAAGMNDYLGKPFQPAELEAMLLKWMPEARRVPRPDDLAASQSAAVAEITPERAIDHTILDTLRGVTGDKFPVILQSFTANAQRLMAEMVQAQAESDMAAVARAAHALRSSAGQLGAVALSRSAGEIESLAHDGDDTATAPLVAVAAEQLRTALAEIAAL